MVMMISHEILNAPNTELILLYQSGRNSYTFDEVFSFFIAIFCCNLLPIYHDSDGTTNRSAQPTIQQQFITLI
jgi:hypothetical protein